MDVALRVLFRPKLRSPILVAGLPGVGDVGKIAVGYLLNSARAELFAELYSAYFPDVAIAGEDGTCRLPRYEFWASLQAQPNFIVLTGDMQPHLETGEGPYKICNAILGIAEDYGCKLILIVGGRRGPLHKVGEVYVAATSEKMAAELCRLGARLHKTRVTGLAGLMLGLSRLTHRKGACILGVTPGTAPDAVAGERVFRFLRETMKPSVLSQLVALDG